MQEKVRNAVTELKCQGYAGKVIENAEIFRKCFKLSENARKYKTISENISQFGLMSETVS